MSQYLPLQGIRLHLAGSIPEDATPEQAEGIAAFVKELAKSIFREGGMLIHGSHPTLDAPLRAASQPFVAAGGARDALTLVRNQKHAVSPEQQAQIAAQREYARVELIPSLPGDPNQSLVPMREWMAERCDVVVAVGGKHYGISKERAGLPKELEATLQLGKPGFLVGGFGGSTEGYAHDNEGVFSRLRNGLSTAENRDLAARTDVNYLVSRIVLQLPLLPLKRGRVPSGRLFRILALDGGGLRGTFTAAVLAQWDQMLQAGGGNRIVNHFDLVAGTSTGAILAIGLGLGLTPLEILNFYRKKGPEIFPKDRRLRHWLKSKHESATLRAMLEGVFGHKRLQESCCRLVLPTVRAIHGEAEAIVTPHSPDRGGFAPISAVEAALASSAAPTYFDEARVDSPVAPGIYLDGGIWANNPVLPALAEAVRHLQVPLERIDVLSIGTMGHEVDFSAALGQGKAGWAVSSADLFFAAQEHGAAILAESFLSPARHLRLNQLTPSEVKLDDREAIEDMALRGANVGRDSFPAVRSRFLDGFHVPDWHTAN